VGQYSNLGQQAKSLGLGERFHEVKDMYRRVNFLFIQGNLTYGPL
jgi:pyruvate carboxylase